MPWVAGVTHTPGTNRTALHLPLLSCHWLCLIFHVRPNPSSAFQPGLP